MQHHPFRFAAGAAFTSPQGWIETARKVEALGYSTLVSGGHPSFGGPGPISALIMAATATTTVHLGTLVLENDFRHPVMLAQEASTQEVLSDERFELGLEIGCNRDDYTALGVIFDAPSTRVRRLEEAVPLIKRLFHEDTVTFSGSFYTTHNARLALKPTRRPHPPLLIGGGGRRMLSLAGREADIVSLDPKGTAAGSKDIATTTPAALVQQIAWVREAAGPRFDALELHLLLYHVAITEHQRQAAEQIAQFMAYTPSSIMINTQMSVEDVLASPRFLIGTVDEIVEQLQARREQYGISYISFLQFPGFADFETFSPVVARLAGT